MKLTVRQQAASSWAGFRVLVRRFGLPRAIRLGARGERAPDPFARLGKAGSLAEELSRQQLAPAARLYRVLAAEFGPEEASEATREVVVAATLAFLAVLVGPLDLPALLALSPEHRLARVGDLVARFFNAEGRVDAAGDDGFDYRVHRCHFVELCTAIGLPELAPLLCEGDLAYFNRDRLRLARPSTLASGGDACLFRFRVVPPGIDGCATTCRPSASSSSMSSTTPMNPL
jgi:hypothetical protein